MMKLSELSTAPLRSPPGLTPAISYSQPQPTACSAPSPLVATPEIPLYHRVRSRVRVGSPPA